VVQPEDILRPVKSILRGKADIVIGARLLSEGSKSLIPGYRRVITFISRTFSYDGVSNTQSGLRAYS